MNIRRNDGYVLLMSLTVLMVMSIHSIHFFYDSHLNIRLLEEMINYAFH